MTEMARWRDEIARMEARLTRHERDRDASTPGSRLWLLEQDEADQVHWRLRAYRCAEAVLEDLYDRYDAAQSVDSRQWHASRAAGRWWARTTLVIGIVGGLFALARVTLEWWWLYVPVIMAVLACIGAARAAVTSYRDVPDDALCDQLRARIVAVRAACRDCDSQDGYDYVDRILYPRPAGNSVTHQV